MNEEQEKQEKYKSLKDGDLVVVSTVLGVARALNASGVNDEMVEVNTDLRIPLYLYKAIEKVAYDSVSVVIAENENERLKQASITMSKAISIMFKVAFYITVINWDEVVTPERVERMKALVETTASVIDPSDLESINSILERVLEEIKRQQK